MLNFRNSGLIDLDTIRLMGVNVKETKNPIGYFGTGLKFAIATILRLGGNVTLYRGLDEYRFTTAKKLVRGQPIDVILMNGEQLGFTLQMGKNWEGWMAFRELYSNMLDEGGTFAEGEAPAPQEGQTLFVVKGIDDEAHKLSEIFLQSKPLCTLPGLEIHLGKSSWLYYRGVRVYKLEKPSFYTYNLIKSQILTEDRTLRHAWEAVRVIPDAIASCDDEAILTRVLTKVDQNHLEYSFDFDCSWFTYSQTFWDVCGRAGRGLNQTAKAAWMRKFQVLLEFQPLRLTKFQRRLVDKAKAIAARLGFPIDDFPVEFVTDLGEGVLGRAKDGKCYISAYGLSKGARSLVATFIEEYIHLRHFHADCSREFQDFLLETLVSFAEEHVLGEPI